MLALGVDPRAGELRLGALHLRSVLVVRRELRAERDRRDVGRRMLALLAVDRLLQLLEVTERGAEVLSVLGLTQVREPRRVGAPRGLEPFRRLLIEVALVGADVVDDAGGAGNHHAVGAQHLRDLPRALVEDAVRVRVGLRAELVLHALHVGTDDLDLLASDGVLRLVARGAQALLQGLVVDDVPQDAAARVDAVLRLVVEERRGHLVALLAWGHLDLDVHQRPLVGERGVSVALGVGEAQQRVGVVLLTPHAASLQRALGRLEHLGVGTHRTPGEPHFHFGFIVPRTGDNPLLFIACGAAEVFRRDLFPSNFYQGGFDFLYVRPHCVTFEEAQLGIYLLAICGGQLAALSNSSGILLSQRSRIASPSALALSGRKRPFLRHFNLRRGCRLTLHATGDGSPFHHGLRNSGPTKVVVVVMSTT